MISWDKPIRYFFSNAFVEIWHLLVISRELKVSQALKKNQLLFINIHPNVLLDTNYKSGETIQLLKELNISPKQIVFELTEKRAVADFDEFEYVLSHYRSQGFRIAIDDAGTGYNSLKTLIYLKPEFIKSLVDNISVCKIKEALQIGQYSILYIDLDNFKSFNGTYGFKKGDLLIQRTAAILENNFKEQDGFLGHIGGDDFISILNHYQFDQVCTSIIKDFDNSIIDFYNKVHL